MNGNKPSVWEKMVLVHKRYYPCIHLQGSRNTMKIFQMTNSLAENHTDYLLHVSLKHYYYTNQLTKNTDLLPHSLFAEFSTAWVVCSKHLHCRNSHDIGHINVYA